MLAELRKVREQTLAFIEETRERDLSKYHMPHTFLGALNEYEWFQMIASHALGHTKEMKEIAQSLPKSVTSLQKERFFTAALPFGLKTDRWVRV